VKRVAVVVTRSVDGPAMTARVRLRRYRLWGELEAVAVRFQTKVEIPGIGAPGSVSTCCAPCHTGRFRYRSTLEFGVVNVHNLSRDVMPLKVFIVIFSVIIARLRR